MKKPMTALLLCCLLTFVPVKAKASANTAQQTFTLTISAPLTITTPAALPGGTAGQAYSITLQATGGVAPYIWSMATGSTLPVGMTLTAAGVLSGTPTTAGSYTFTIVVTDSKLTLVKAVTTVTVPAPVKK